MALDLHFHTDASETLGYGAYYHPHWFRGDWDPDQLLEALEFPFLIRSCFQLFLQLLYEGSEWSRKQILVFL